MKYILGVLLICGFPLFAQTYTSISAEGNVQLTLIASLAVSNSNDIDYGEISIKGSGTVNIDPNDGHIECISFKRQNCPKTGQVGEFIIDGPPNSTLKINISDAVLASPTGQILNFRPIYAQTIQTNSAGEAILNVGGKVEFSGKEKLESFSTANSSEGGTPYTITISH